MELQALLDQINGQIKELKAAERSLKGVILAQAYIVKCGVACLAFDIEPGRFACNPRVVQAHQATRFSRAEALCAAGKVKNDQGEAGSIEHIRNAIDEALISLLETRARLEAISRESHSQRLEMAEA